LYDLPSLEEIIKNSIEEYFINEELDFYSKLLASCITVKANRIKLKDLTEKLDVKKVQCLINTKLLTYKPELESKIVKLVKLALFSLLQKISNEQLSLIIDMIYAHIPINTY